MNILLTLAFDGTNYSGFQVQRNALSICEVLQNSIEKLFKERLPVIACSRTDSGVHATGFRVQFAYDLDMSFEKLPLALNAHLPHDVRVVKAEPVPENFHARYNAKYKKYVYKIHNSAVDSPFIGRFSYRIGEELDVEQMQKAAHYLIGTHDFASFMSAGSDITDTVRTITKLKVERKNQELTIAVEADGYLYNMVRIIVGTLVQVGNGKRTPESMVQVLKSKNRNAAGPTMPAKGLFLENVIYED